MVQKRVHGVARPASVLPEQAAFTSPTALTDRNQEYQNLKYQESNQASGHLGVTWRHLLVDCDTAAKLYNAQ